MEAARIVQSLISSKGFADYSEATARVKAKQQKDFPHVHVAIPADIAFLSGLEALQRDLTVRLHCFFMLNPLATVEDAERYLLPFLREQPQYKDIKSFAETGMGSLAQFHLIKKYISIRDGDLHPQSVPATEVLFALHQLMISQRRPKDGSGGEARTEWKQVFEKVLEL